MSTRGTRILAAAGPLAAGSLGGLATDPDSRWFRRAGQAAWYPPPQAFGIVWTGLYAGMAWAGGRSAGRGGGPGVRPRVQRRTSPQHRLDAAVLPGASALAGGGGECRPHRLDRRPGCRASPVSRAAAGFLTPVRGVDGVRDGADRGDRPAELDQGAVRLEHLVDEVDRRVRRGDVPADDRGRGCRSAVPSPAIGESVAGCRRW